MSDYDNVRIENLSTSFRNGLAFCAIIHHFRPHLVDYESLHPANILINNRLAFSLAETHLGIASLLDPQVSSGDHQARQIISKNVSPLFPCGLQDMVEYEVPDKFSIATYLAQYYHRFKHEDGSRFVTQPRVSCPAA